MVLCGCSAPRPLTRLGANTSRNSTTMRSSPEHKQGEELDVAPLVVVPARRLDQVLEGDAQKRDLARVSSTEPRNRSTPSWQKALRLHTTLKPKPNRPMVLSSNDVRKPHPNAPPNRSIVVAMRLAWKRRIVPSRNGWWKRSSVARPFEHKTNVAPIKNMTIRMSAEPTGT